MTNNAKHRKRLYSMVLTALFCAMAYVVSLVFHFKVSFLTFDAKDTVICISGMLLGPVTSTVVALVVSLIEFISVSDTGFWGLIMNFVSSATFALTAGLIYRNIRKMWGAVVGMVSAVAAGTAVMLLLDILVIPLYINNVSSAAVVSMIPTLLLPFNLVKYTLNAALVLAIYKPISTALKRSGLLPTSPAEKISHNENEDYKFGVRTVVVLVAALLVVVGCVLVLVFVLHGTFELGKN